MADDKSNRGPADRARINIREAYEVEYWRKELGSPRIVCVNWSESTGVMAADIRKALSR